MPWRLVWEATVVAPRRHRHMARTMPHFLRFASDATLFALWGGALLALSAMSFWGDRRRMRRKEIDAVGLIPWRDLAAYTAFGGLVLLAVGIAGWIRG